MPRDQAPAVLAWVPLLGGDPLPWLLASDEPAARWVTLTGVLDRPDDDPQVLAARAAVVADPGTRELLGRLPDWEAGERLSGHDSPRFAPNLLNLLADMGVQESDDPRVGRLLAQLLAHQDPAGRFPSFAASRSGAAPVWGALLCDSHAVLEVLVRYGRGDHPRVQAALARMAADLAPTAQGRAWPCLPHPVTGFRGPGRTGDCCPQVTLEALRTFARLPRRQRPDGLGEVARVALRAWRVRGREQPYMFGHGRRFKTVKWPVTWYGAYTMLDALGRYPALWRSPGAPTRATVRRWPSWPPAWSPTTPARTGPSRPGRPGMGSRAARSGRSSTRRGLPPPGCWRCCTAWTTWPRPPPPSTSAPWEAPKAAAASPSPRARPSPPDAEPHPGHSTLWRT